MSGVRFRLENCRVADVDASDVIKQAKEVSAFIVLLQALWSDEPWEVVEPFAERAWARIPRLGNNWQWHCVRDVVQEAWLPQRTDLR